jgi:hypothetical protein
MNATERSLQKSRVINRLSTGIVEKLHGNNFRSQTIIAMNNQHRATDAWNTEQTTKIQTLGK